MDRKNPWKNEGFRPHKKGVGTTKNEGNVGSHGRNLCFLFYIMHFIYSSEKSFPWRFSWSGSGSERKLFFLKAETTIFLRLIFIWKPPWNVINVYTCIYIYILIYFCTCFCFCIFFGCQVIYMSWHAWGLNTYGWSKMTIYNASHLLWQQIQTDNGAPESTWGQARLCQNFLLVMMGLKDGNCLPS